MSARSYEVLDRPDITSVLFYPRRDVGVAKLSAGAFAVRIPVASDVELGGRVYAAQEGAPVVLFFHGNGEIASDYDTIASFYTDLGITLFVVDYRGYGVSDGTPTATALVHDANVCFERVPEILQSLGITAGPLFVMGRSLGSAAAAEIVRHNPENLAGLIIESGFAFTFPLIERIGFLQMDDAFEHKDGFGNLDKIAAATMPTLIIHGERDLIIPISDAEALFEASPAKEKRFLRIPGAGHNDLMLVGCEEYFRAVGILCGVWRESATSKA